MGLGDIVSDVTNAVGLTNNGSSLSKFLSKYNSTAGHYVDVPDPLNTFDCTFEFWPNKLTSNEKGPGVGDKLLDIAKNAGKTALNNITGGLVDLDSIGAKGITDSRNEFDSNTREMTFMQYLSESNLMGQDILQKEPQLIIDFSYYIQNISIPGIGTAEDSMLKTLMGEFPTFGPYVKVSGNTINMEILNTKAPIIERLFYPWMKEVTLPQWSYETQPYTTADIIIDFKKHADVKYIFVGSRPIQIDTYNPSQEITTMTRPVTFAFDYMFVASELETVQSIGDKLLDLGSSLGGGALKTFGL